MSQVVYMANQIARNFAVRGEEVAVSEMADHLAQFWDPRMKEAIHKVDPDQLSDIARAAVQRLGAMAERSSMPEPQS